LNPGKECKKVLLKKKDQLSGAFWLFVALVTIQQAWGLKIGSFRSPGPGYIPLMAGLGMAVISAIIFLRATLSSPGKDKFSWGMAEGAGKKLGLVLAGLFLYAFLFSFLGFVISTFLLLLFLLKGVEPQRWVTALIWSGGITFFAYLLFVVILRSELPTGFFGI
jgi:hypothetical protein